MENPLAVHPVNRRTFLVASALGWLGNAPEASGKDQKQSGSARSTILFFLCGGASHIDTWDLKPDAPDEYRGPFKPIATAASGLRLCEHLPMLSRQARHLAVVNSVRASVPTNDHHAGYYYHLTGHPPDSSFLAEGNNRRPRSDDWPFLGSVVAAKRPPHRSLPNVINMPAKPGQPANTRPGQFSARLGVDHDPFCLRGSPAPPRLQAPALVLEGDVSLQRLVDREQLLRKIDSARSGLDADAKVRTYSRQQERALSLLARNQTAQAFDVTSEDPRLRERYGNNLNAMGLLVARRLVEAGVPFITVFWREVYDKSANLAWDTHKQNFEALQNRLLPEFDRAFSALVEDLEQRGLLEKTLLLVTSEMGRQPKIGDHRSGGLQGGGRDHWTHCMSVLFAGGGVRGGQVYGSSDRRAEFPSERQVTPAHIARTVYHAMGIDNLEARDQEGRVYDLLADGEALVELF